MTQLPNLRLPELPVRPPQRGAWTGLVVVLLLVVIGLQVWPLVAARRRPTPASSGPPTGLAVQQKVLAGKLENANLSAAAADAWQAYLTAAVVEPQEAANIHYRIGKLRQDAGQFEAAVSQYFLAEELLEGDSGDLGRQIGLRVGECLRRLGRYSDLARDVAARASSGDAGKSLEDQQVVAEVSGEKITAVDFDRLLTEDIEAAIKMQPGLSPADEDTMRRQAHEQFADPRVRAGQLQSIVARRVLAQEARQQGVDQSEEFKKRLTSVADRELATTLLLQEIQKRATVTDADVQRFYQAEKERYVQPASTAIAHILCRSEEDARQMIARIKSGASFEELAKAESLDSATKPNGGAVAEPVPADGDKVPMFGANRELHDKIRSAEAGHVLDDPVKGDGGWHVLKVTSHRERVERPFEEIKDRVRSDAGAARTREVTEQYIRELFEKLGVKLYPEVFLKSKGAATQPAPADAARPKP